MLKRFDPSPVRLQRLVLALTLFSAAYFHGGAASNQNARLDAVFGFVEPSSTQGTFRIDRFLVAPERDINTADWARAGQHYYANKAPGSILLGSAAYAGLYGVERLLQLDPLQPRLQLANSYLINLCVSVLALGCLAVVMFRLHCLTMQPLSAAWLTLALCLGTGLFPYATQLWGHTTTAALVFGGLYALQRAGPRAAFWGAFCFASAVATDYLVVLIALLAGVARCFAKPRDVLPLALGALLPLGFVLAYQAYCFGSAWTLATSVSNPAYTDARRVLGMFAWPDLHALWQITLGPYRGVLLHMPILWLTPLGFFCWWRRAAQDPWLWCCAIGLAMFTLAVASFNGWHGGSTVCARYLLPCLPLAFVAFGQIEWKAWSVRVACVLGLLSVSNMLAVAAVNPLCPDEHPNPLYGYTYSALWSGKVAPYAFPIRLLQFDPSWPGLREWAMWNWGELAGLRGGWSLVPLLIVWAACALQLARVAARRVTRAPQP